MNRLAQRTPVAIAVVIPVTIAVIIAITQAAASCRSVKTATGIITGRVKCQRSARRIISCRIFNNDHTRIIGNTTIIGVVEIIPGIVTVPWIVPTVIISVRVISVSVVKIIVIQSRPAIAILQSHSQEPVFVVIV